jgi:ATP10 protein
MAPINFPTVSATTLAGRPVRFPDETRGRVGLLLVAFRQRAQADINTWVAPLIKGYLAAPEVAYYEIPMISGGYRPAARLIDGGMRGGVPEALHDSTATCYAGRRTFMTDLGIRDRSRAYLFVLDRAGTITFRAQGLATSSAVESARAAIEAALAD